MGNKNIKKALFLYLLNRKIENFDYLDFDDIMSFLKNFFICHIHDFYDLFIYLLDFEINNDKEVKIIESFEDREDVEACFKRFKIGDLRLVGKLSMNEYKYISELANLFTQFYIHEIMVDEELCDMNLRRQALFYSALQLGLSNKVDSSNVLDFYMNIDEIRIVYDSIISGISDFIASLHFKSMKKTCDIDIENLKSVFAYSIADNGTIVLIDNESSHDKVISYIDRLQRGDISLYNGFNKEEIEYISRLASLYIDYLNINYDLGDLNKKEIKHSRKRELSFNLVC